jgi:hypothetical protein
MKRTGRHGAWGAIRWGVVAATILVGLFTPPTWAADWLDDFEDGKVDDGQPVTWIPHDFLPGEYFVEDGDYHLAGIDPSEDNETLLSFVDADFVDGSVRTLGFTQGDGNIAVGARIDPDTLNGYVGLIDHGGQMVILRSDFGADLIPLGEIELGELGIDASTNLFLQLDVLGTELSLTAWRPGTTMPEAQLTATDDFYTDGVAGLLYNEDDPETSGVYRFAQASSTRLVGPVPGDANSDGKVDLTDFGILKSNFGTGTTMPEGDFDFDKKVDLTDFGILKENFGKGGAAAVPEPSGATLLALGGLAACALGIRRRRSAGHS